MAVTIESVIQSNLEMLDRQEEQLVALLEKIRTAKSLFSGRPIIKRRGRRPGRPKLKVARALKVGRGRRKRTGTYMEDIAQLLGKNGKMKSGDLIKSIAKKRGKDYRKLQFSIYPVLSEALKSNKLAKSNGFFTMR